MAGLPQNIEFMRDELGTLYYLTQLGERINVSLYKPGESPVIASQDLTGGVIFSNGITFDDASRFNYLTGSAQVLAHVFGNSIMASGYNSAIERLATLSSRIQVIQNSAVGGTNSTQVLQQMKDIGFNPSAHIVIFMEGANDAAQGVSVAAHAANMQAMIDLVRKAGKIPVMVKPGPTDNAYQTLLDKIAFADHVLAQKNRVPLIDLFQAISKPQGGFVSGKSTDSLHPNTRGAGDSAAYGATDLLNKRPPQHLPRAPSSAGLFTNVTMLTDSNTDGVPDGWTNFSGGNTSCAISPTALPGVGNKVVVTSTSSASRPGFFKQATPLPAAGDVLLMTGRVRLVSSTSSEAILYVDMREGLTAGGNADTSMCALTSITTEPVYFENRITVRSGVNAVYVVLGINTQADASASASVFEFEGIDIYNLTALGLA